MTTMFQVSVTPAIASLTALRAVLGKGAAHAAARGIDPAVLLGSRLAPDMFPLTRQVQIATDMVRNGAARLAGVPLVPAPDTETTFEALQARIDATTGFLGTLTPTQIDGSEERAVSLKLGGNDVTFAGLPYWTGFVLPNLYFHTTTAYVILRHNGVELGKRDFIGALPG